MTDPTRAEALSPEDRAALPGLLEAATPGPWTYHADGDANHYALLHEGGQRWLISFLHNGEHLTARQEANARLIALAPALARAVLAAEARLALADRLAEAAEQVHAAHTVERTGEAADALDAALAAYRALATPAREGGENG